MLAGAVLTALVQSSSVFTSTLTPLVGVGVLTLERVYPLSLGSNVGTTSTGVLAALASPAYRFQAALQVALCHLLFNVTGIALFYSLPAARLPVRLAKGLGATTARYRWFAVVYLVGMFFVVPLIVFGLSAAGHGVLPVVLAVLGVVAVCAATLTMFQRHRAECLPAALQSWDWLPTWMRSLEPVDRVIRAVVAVVRRTCCPCLADDEPSDEDDTATAQSAATGDRMPGHHTPASGEGRITLLLTPSSWTPLLKRGDVESGYSSVATSPMPSRFPSCNVIHTAHVADTISNDDGQ